INMSSETTTPTTPATPPTTTPQKTFTMSCHCGGVKFQAEMDQDLAKSGRCNCSSCFITRLWVHPVTDLTTFKLLTPAENITQYFYATKTCGHHFCKTCGTQTHLQGDYPGYGPYIFVSVNCIQGLTQEEFSNIKLRYTDGANDSFKDVPKFTKHL
ncbi:hypothetical protein SAMD00019534_021080, partial [Acytostelium subglobosum LB1]|uniref:hypothetical protein n=1 Tax=Acytostelium subglobosum LB1 TaxID=1410327 RepID=UPI000644FA2F